MSDTAPTGPITFPELSRMSLTRLKSVGDGKRAESFGKFEVQNLLDLLTHYPRRWIDRTKEATIASAIEGADSLVIGEVKSVTAPPRGGRGGPSRVTATIADESGRLSIVFFNQPWRERQLKVGSFVAVFGRLGSFNGTKQMANPTVDILGDPDERPRPIIAVYPQSEKIDLPSWLVLKAVDETLSRCRARGIHDPVSVAMRKKYKLMDRQSALTGIHVPETFAEKEMARRRLAFDELLRVQLVLVMRKRAIERDSVGIQHKTNGQLVSRFYQHLPYQLTGAQQRVIAEIESDLAGPHPMHRLLQGDVGAGKTIVAVAAMLTAVQGGHQGAIMAPTEVLAEQHAVGIRQLLQGLVIPDADSLFGEREVRVELLTSSVTAERRRDVLAGLADGRVDIAIGTHALIQETVVFHSLGVVVVDEQHRFGVEQRAALRAKGEGAGAVPDVLVMTATPIPRTAAMTVYGDLDVSVLDEKPAGRTPIVTRSAQSEDQLEEVWADVRAEVAAGRQVYVVCPLIEESEKLEVASAEETIERLASGELRGLKLEFLHGRMSSAEKESVMNQFRSGGTAVLVATTVIEVGVDVPNATIMVILDADRFGIAQLHQLRGRVGRGVHASRCWLVTTTKETEVFLQYVERLTKQRIEIGKLPSEVDLRKRRLEATKDALRERIAAGGLDETREFVESLAQEFELIDIAAAAIAMANDAADKGVPAFAPDEPGPPAGQARYDDRPANARYDDRPRERRQPATGSMTLLRLSVGKEDSVRPADLVGAIAGEAKISSSAIGAIKVHDDYSLVEIPDELAARVITALKSTKIRGNKVTVQSKPAR